MEFSTVNVHDKKPASLNALCGFSVAHATLFAFHLVVLL